MKIGFLYQFHDVAGMEREFSHMRENGTPIHGIQVSRVLSYNMDVGQLDFQYCMKNPQVRQGLERLKDACADFDVIISYGTLQIHPDFIAREFADKPFIFWCGDDPISSVIHTLPYLGVADHVFCQSPCYLDGEPMVDWLRKMGARKATYVPQGYFESWKRGLSNDGILSHARDIEISFVGSPAWRRDLLLGVKRRYGARLKIYSNSWHSLRSVAYDALKGGVLQVVRPAKDESEIYFRSWLSINSNGGSGPSTARTFHVPICGALELCDFPEGLKYIFDLDRHVLPYEFLSVSSLCSAIDYALSNKAELDERRRAGFWHVNDNYRFAHVLAKTLKKIL